jgi:hypothetical protein
MSYPDLILEALQAGPSSPGYSVSRRLAERYPEAAVLQTEDWEFGLDEYAADGHRKYHFEVPGPIERREYLALFNGQLQPAMRVSDAALERLADRTDGFSFAYLK